MIPKASTRADSEVNGRLWRFSNCEFDEFSRELRANGKPVEIEAKPLDVLHELLLHAGEVVTKDELIEAVWAGVSVVEGSLATAISKLRKALADATGDENSNVVITVPRIGYRLGVPVQYKETPPPPTVDETFAAGDPVPGRDQWQLTRRLDASVSSEVWLAEHPKTRETRVFKFARDGVRLKGLKREVTLARVLREALGDRHDFVRLLEWNFDTLPYYLESEYSGPDLVEWSAQQGGIDKVPYEIRIRILLEIAQAVAAAHEVGILHKDLKPANVLIAPTTDGDWQVKVADFGSGGLVEPERLGELGITNLGFTRTGTIDGRSLTGTLMYMAPEVLAGHVPTASADVFALGVILYQLASGDLLKPIAPGWEADIDDPLIREDVADSASGDMAKRLPTVAALIERLQTLEQRRATRNELERATARAQAAERHLAEARARRPWVFVALVILLIGMALSFELYLRASRERDRANHETEISNAMNRFLTTDLLGRSDPFRGGQSGTTLVEAVTQAMSRIDRQFHDAPEVAAGLHHSIARALDNRTDYVNARSEYERASALFRQTEGTLSQNAIIVNLQRASMEARTYQQGALQNARSLLSEQELLLPAIPHPRDEVLVWLASARGMIALIANDAKTASEQFQAAYDKSQGLPAFDESARLTLKQRAAFSYIRLGEGTKAERLFRELIAGFSQTDGPESASVLRVRLNLAQSVMIQGRNEDAVRETRSVYPLYVAKLGANHELTMQLLTTQAQCEGALGRYEDSIRDDMTVYHAAVEKQGPTSFFAIASLTDAAQAQCRMGRYNEGEPNARKSYEISAQTFGPRAGLTGGVAHALATCLIGMGKLPEASKLLDSIDTDAVAQLTGFPDWSANVALSKGQIAVKLGNYAAARKYLDAARPLLSRQVTETYQKQSVADLAAAVEKHQSVK